MAAALPEITYPPELPITDRREDLLAAIAANQVVIVAGETGSGKSTQLPKLCLELGRGGDGMIAHTQPRRLAARTLAQRIAEELAVPLGGVVGYAVRFDNRSGRDTRIRLMTDGLLLAEIQRDRRLRRYDTIIVDEAHERSLNIDFLLGCLARLLPERPDLKLIITSATIDVERFAEHFGDAPIVEVSGRTHPVDLRYRPIDDPRTDQADAIGDAVEELLHDTTGDVLVFLSGEREIRDTADALEGRLPDRVEILPLYARLSNAEQQRVFKRGPHRRVVLSTNVAETSLTVPGIRSVVDPGTARVSRYSARLKVQRLPIEPVSQASADQRKGRCGREAPGVCIRLYSEADFDARPRFTDPEILRTNLASVILQMLALGLGEIEKFPFLDPPDARQIRDGVNLLHELGALDPDGRRLTPLGKRLARLPVDPRLGRMVLEAGRLGCAAEVIVIAAALSIQDPRERPAEEREAADALHARFKDPDSDFLALANLWRYLEDRRAELSRNQFRKRCRSEFLHHLRVREWQDLVAQLRDAAEGAGVTPEQTPGEPDHIARALLSGLLSHVGLRDAGRREYQGARGAAFALWPGSGLAKKPPDWVMVAELVETSRLWGRTAGRISPKWIEPLAGHIVRRAYAEPRWDRRRGAVVATESVTLYGLPVVSARTVAYGRIDPEASRALFIRKALVEGDWDTRHAFVAENARRLEQLAELEDRTRRRDLMPEDARLAAFFEERIPGDVVSGAHFDRWWRDARAAAPDLLSFPAELLSGPASTLDAAAFPPGWKDGPRSYRLSYRFEPGAPDDGVTVHLPLAALAQIDGSAFEWLVPGLRRDLVTALLRSLPKELRRPLTPIPELAEVLAARLSPRRLEPLLDVVAREVQALRGVRVEAGAWDTGRLPAHLRMKILVEDETGAVVGGGDDLEAVRAALAPKLRAQLADAAAGLETTGLVAWTIGTLPRTVELPGAGDAVRAYPALVDEGETAGVRVLETTEAQAHAMRRGTRRLVRLTCPSPAKSVRDRLGSTQQLALAAAPHGSVGALIEDAAEAAADALIASGGGPAWDEAGFARLRGHVAGELAETTLAIVHEVAAVLDAERAVRRTMEGMTTPALQPAVLDVARQLGRLLGPGFIARTGASRIADVERYLRAAARRLERLPDAVAADADRMRVLHELEAAYRERLEAWPKGRPLPAALREVPWLLEELRVAQFAQGLGVRSQASAKKVRRLLSEA